jgi:hypothetical protein
VAETTIHSGGGKLSIFALAAVVILTVVGGAFAIGYLIGRMFM